MRVFCVLVPGGGGPPACRPRRELPARRPFGAPARRLRSLCSLACLRVAAWGGGPPARRPRRELRSARRLEARAASYPLAVRRAASCPLGIRAASCLLAVRGACVLLLVCVLAPGGGGPPARRPRRELRSARRSLSGQALPPPPGTRANTGAWLLALSRPGRIVRRGEPATEQDTPTRHGLVTGSDAPRAVFAVSA